eukprot:2053518-Prymnesium_polylepis.1
MYMMLCCVPQKSEAKQHLPPDALPTRCRCSKRTNKRPGRADACEATPHHRRGGVMPCMRTTPVHDADGTWPQAQPVVAHGGARSLSGSVDGRDVWQRLVGAPARLR